MERRQTWEERPVPVLLAGEYNNAGKKGLRDGKERILVLPRLHPPRQKISPEGEPRVNRGAETGGDAASGIDVINKSVNGVSGLMSVVSRWLGGRGGRVSQPPIQVFRPPPSLQSFSSAPYPMPPSFD